MRCSITDIHTQAQNTYTNISIHTYVYACALVRLCVCFMSMIGYVRNVCIRDGNIYVAIDK